MPQTGPCRRPHPGRSSPPRRSGLRSRRRRHPGPSRLGARSAPAAAGWSRSSSSCSPAAAPTATPSPPSSRRWGSRVGPVDIGQVYRTLRDLEARRPGHVVVVDRARRTAAARLRADAGRLRRDRRVGGGDEGASAGSSPSSTGATWRPWSDRASTVDRSPADVRGGLTGGALRAARRPRDRCLGRGGPSPRRTGSGRGRPGTAPPRPGGP